MITYQTVSDGGGGILTARIPSNRFTSTFRMSGYEETFSAALRTNLVLTTLVVSLETTFIIFPRARVLVWSCLGTEVELVPCSDDVLVYGNELTIINGIKGARN